MHFFLRNETNGKHEWNIMIYVLMTRGTEINTGGFVWAWAVIFFKYTRGLRTTGRRERIYGTSPGENASIHYGATFRKLHEDSCAPHYVRGTIPDVQISIRRNLAARSPVPEYNDPFVSALTSDSLCTCFCRQPTIRVFPRRIAQVADSCDGMGGAATGADLREINLCSV